MSTHKHCQLVALGLALAASGASAQDFLYAGTESGFLLRGQPTTGDFEIMPFCLGQMNDLTADGSTIFMTGDFTHISRFSESLLALDSPLLGSETYVASDLHHSHLMTVDAQGIVQMLNKSDGSLLGTFDSHVPATTLHVVGDRIFVGSDIGIVMSSPVGQDSFAFWGLCGGPITSMTSDGTHLILGTAGGVAYRLDLATELLTNTFNVHSDMSALTAHQGVLFVGDTDGGIQRVVAASGLLLDTWEVDFAVTSLDIGSGSSVGTIYCFGQTDCPCANQGGLILGCRNSTGVGSSLSVEGSATVTGDDLEIHAGNLPINAWGRFYMGATASRVMFGDGLLCTGAGGYGIYRFPVRNAGPSGVITEGPGIVTYTENQFAGSGHIHPGSTWYFQVWYRDPTGPCGAAFNTSPAASVTFAP